MSASSKVATLSGLIKKNRQVLKRIESYYRSFIDTEMDQGDRKTSDAIVIADRLVNYYTCLETIFVRISQFFENDLNREKWHRDLLEKMTLQIDDIREAVISDETYIPRTRPHSPHCGLSHVLTLPARSRATPRP